MARRHFISERASALMLVPAGLLVLILLGAISADSALAFMGQRELDNQVAAAANDAATESVNGTGAHSLQSGNEALPDPALAQQIVAAHVNHVYSGGLTLDNVQTTVNGNSVTVSAQGRVHYIFAGAIPGASHYANVRVQSTAQLKFGN